MADFLNNALKELEAIKISRLALMIRLDDAIKNNAEYEKSELEILIAELDNKYRDYFPIAWSAALEAIEALKNTSTALELNVSHLKANILTYLKMINIKTEENIH